MVHVSNSPAQPLMLRMETRKPFVLRLCFKDSLNRPLDLTGITGEFNLGQRARVQQPSGVVLTSAITITDATGGLAKVDLQADDLDLRPGVYSMDLALTDSNNFSALVLKGSAEIVDNNGFTTPASTSGDGLDSLVVKISDNTLHMTLEKWLPQDLLHVPTGGMKGDVLVKASDGDHDLTWDVLPTASQSLSGFIRLATEAQALEGDNPLHAMTPATSMALFLDRLARAEHGLPQMDGEATEGVLLHAAREDHVHPSDTSKAEVGHLHPIADVTGLQAALDAKAERGPQGRPGDPGPVGPQGYPGILPVEHGDDPDVERPDAGIVHWIGSTLPNNADIWDFMTWEVD